MIKVEIIDWIGEDCYKQVVFKSDESEDTYIIGSLLMSEQNARKIAISLEEHEHPLYKFDPKDGSVTKILKEFDLLDGDFLKAEAKANKLQNEIHILNEKKEELEEKGSLAVEEIIKVKQLADDWKGTAESIQNRFDQFKKIDHENLKVKLEGYKGELADAESNNNNLIKERGDLEKGIEELKSIIRKTESDLYNLKNSKSTEIPDGQTCNELLQHRMKESGLFK